MAGGSKLKVSAALWNALPSDLRDPSTVEARRVMVLAAYLDLLSADFGLSDHYEDRLQQRSRQPSGFLPFTSHYLSDTSGLIEAEDVRDRLYAVLVELAKLVDSGSIHAVGRPDLTSNRLLTTAQIYWAISRDERTRPDLVFKGGPNIEGRDKRGRPTLLRAVIWVDAKGTDAATLRRTQRAELMNGLGTTSGSALRAEGAHIAVMAARHIIANDHRVPPPLNEAMFGDATVTGHNRRIASIDWDGQQPLPTDRAGSDTAAPAQTGSGGASLISSLQQLGNEAQNGGMLGEAALLRGVLAAILQERSEADPGDHEAELSAARLQAGLACVTAGRMDEALDHFVNAERSSQTLSELWPRESAHEIRVASSLTMIGLIHLQAGRVPDAEKSLASAVVVSQRLTDKSADNEDILAIALTMLGVLQLQSGGTQEAEKTLDRAVIISQKLTDQRTEDHANQLLLLLALTMLGTLYLASERATDAEEALTRAATTSRQIASRHPSDPTNRLLFANSLTALGSLYVVLDRTEDAEDALISAVDTSQGLARDNPDDTTIRFLLGSALSALGLIYFLSDRAEEAEDALTRTVSILQELAETTTNDPTHLVSTPALPTLLGGALYLLGMVYLNSDRADEAEGSLNRAAAVLQADSDGVQGQKLLETVLDGLAELYEEIGRGQDATDARALRRRLTEQGPEDSMFH